MGLSPGQWARNMMDDDTPMDLILLMAIRELADVSTYKIRPILELKNYGKNIKSNRRLVARKMLVSPETVKIV